MVASSSADRTVRVWSMENGAPIAVFIGHAAAVNGVSFAPNVSGRHNKAFNHLGLPAKRCLLSWSDDGTARLWEAKRKPDSDAIVYRTTPIFNGARKSCRVMSVDSYLEFCSSMRFFSLSLSHTHIK